MKIDLKLVDQFRDAAWDAHTMPDDPDTRLQYIAQRAADHALEEAAGIVENANTPDCGGWTAMGIAEEIRAMKGTS